MNNDLDYNELYPKISDLGIPDISYKITQNPKYKTTEESNNNLLKDTLNKILYPNRPKNILASNFLRYVYPNSPTSSISNKPYYDSNRYPNIKNIYEEIDPFSFNSSTDINRKSYNSTLGLRYNLPDITGNIKGSISNGGYSVGGDASLPNIPGSPSFGINYHNGQKRPDFNARIQNLLGLERLYGEFGSKNNGVYGTLGINLP